MCFLAPSPIYRYPFLVLLAIPCFFSKCFIIHIIRVRT